MCKITFGSGFSNGFGLRKSDLFLIWSLLPFQLPHHAAKIGLIAI